MEQDAMRRMWQFAVAILVGQCFFSGLRCTQAQEALAPAMVKISLQKSIVTQHEPTIVDITIDNSSSAGVDFDLGYNKEKIGVRVIDPDGRTREKGRSLPQEGMRFSSAVHVEPGTASVVPVLLNEWFSIEKIGDYQIDMTLQLPDPRSPNEPSGVSAALTLSVLPRDETKLKLACADLLKRAEDPSSASASIVAAEALSKVDDAAAVPFLVEAMKRRAFTALMVGALARLKTDEALTALTSASRSSDAETSNLARAALAGLGKTKER
jgi:hypothetical protein